MPTAARIAARALPVPAAAAAPLSTAARNSSAIAGMVPMPTTRNARAVAVRAGSCR
jgi:hypothetical protein